MADPMMMNPGDMMGNNDGMGNGMDMMGNPNMVTTTTTSRMYCLTFLAQDIISVDLYKSVNGYAYASVGIRKNNNYVYVNYEWSGEDTPDFVMDLMSFFCEDCCTDCQVTPTQDAPAQVTATKVAASKDDTVKAAYAQFLDRMKENFGR